MIYDVCDFKQIKIYYKEYWLLFKLFLFKSGAEVVGAEVVGAEVVGAEVVGAQVPWLKKNRNV